MSTTATRTCDGCDQVLDKDQRYYSVTGHNPYDYAGDFCSKCWAEKAPASERVLELERQRKDDSALVTELTAKVARAEKRANELNDLLAANRNDRDGLNATIAALNTELHKALDFRDGFEFQTTIITELLGMLGKKARRKHGARLDEIMRELAARQGKP